jgi:hypothetical protein
MKDDLKFAGTVILALPLALGIMAIQVARGIYFLTEERTRRWWMGEKRYGQWRRGETVTP